MPFRSTDFFYRNTMRSIRSCQDAIDELEKRLSVCKNAIFGCASFTLIRQLYL